MKKIRTITFHASYNYGSCLQAYALQEYIKKICNYKCDYKIINLRTEVQKKMYENIYKKNGFKNNLKKFLFFPRKKEIIIKDYLFEKFINEKLELTKEYSSTEELYCEKWDNDTYFIAGSDQLWNLNARDFEWANYLEFTDAERKFSYAASWGAKSQTWNEEEKTRVKKNIQKYKEISVREKGSYNNVLALTEKKAEIHVDPTMLVTKEEWNQLIKSSRIVKGKYIFLYNLKGKEFDVLAKKIAKQLKMSIVVSTGACGADIIDGFIHRYDIGPIEFLNLIKNAELVLSSSFHGTIFSIMLNKPFFSLNGRDDFRINTLLEKFGLEERSIDLSDYMTKCKDWMSINYKKANLVIEEERKKSYEYLKKCLEIM